jgi:peptidoglycan/xylan/chitin deacetylase (PgdA/CDA1 family)
VTPKEQVAVYFSYLLFFAQVSLLFGIGRHLNLTLWILCCRFGVLSRQQNVGATILRPPTNSLNNNGTNPSKKENNMKNILVKSLFFLALATPAVSVFSAENSSFAWPNGQRAAINLAYDDALNSQLDNAIPALDKYGLKGTFYLTLSSETVAKRMADWRAAATNGHELANHTLFHQCSRSSPGRDWVLPHHDLDNVSVAQLKDQIVVGNVMLNAIDGKTERTFTTPCGDHNAAGKSYINDIKSEFVAIKSLFGGVIPDMNTLDPYAVTVAVPHNVTGDELIALVKEAAAKGTMMNFTFHGIGGDHLSVSTEAHDKLLKHLSDNKDIYWVDTFLNIMKYVKTTRKIP